MRVAVVGAGSWGTAVALLADASGLDTRLVCRTQEQADRIRATRSNPHYLPAVTVPPSIVPVALDDPRCLDGVDLVALALPSRRIRDAAPMIVAHLPASAGVLSLTKGLDPTNGDRLSQTWRDLLPAGTPLCVLSGPNHAEEIAVRQPAAAVVAGDRSLARAIQEHLSGPRFRLYVNDDLVGVELCGAAKNVIAIAAGMSDGVGFGDNCKATLITRGLAEMTRLGVACGASEATFRGLAGMGDLVATCTSRHSRNRRAGEMIARGTGADMIEGDIGQVAEGLWTVARLRALAEARGVELPISAEVAAIAFGGRPVLASLEALMTRAPAVEE
ncbi:MAG TPA: NAD(P)H-dependent glycerol-3-phosphate dehydrogenase [Miltoncostaeaceae bacterium]|nr:NAD(P)H-dependent glycerol-3-phosphate dehydrogenase [Miltoncostaeaceae bacterium]